MKEEISVYFRMALGRSVAGKERPRMDGEAENARHHGWLQRGKGGASFPKRVETI